jgi:hypothetical protein
MSDDDVDPEHARIRALLARATEGTVTDAETEELALYAREQPAVAAMVATAVEQGALGEGWLVRVRADVELDRFDRTLRTRVERGTGIGLLLLGFVLQLLAPLAGAPGAGIILAGVGALLLLYSFVRVRLATYAKDPYKDVIR